MNEEMVITMNFSDSIEDVFGKITIAPTVKAQQAWELWQKNPTKYTLAPGYLTQRDENGVDVSRELVELSLIPKMLENKP